MPIKRALSGNNNPPPKRRRCNDQENVNPIKTVDHEEEETLAKETGIAKETVANKPAKKAGTLTSAKSSSAAKAGSSKASSPVDETSEVSKKTKKARAEKGKTDKQTSKSTYNPHIDGKGPSLEGCWKKQIEVDEAQKTGGGELKLAIWNVNGLRAVLHKPKNEHNESGDLQAYLKVEKPDILFLHETKIDPGLEDRCTETINECLDEKDQYVIKFVHSEKKGYAGVAALVKSHLFDSVEKVIFGLGNSDHDEEGRCITLVFPRFVLVSTYVANSGQGLKRLDYRIKEFDKDMHAFLKKLKKQYSRPLIWCGDLNVAYDEKDIWNSKGNQKSAGHTPEERASFGSLIADGEWVDVWRQHNPDGRRYTFWPARSVQSRVENLGWRLDYFISSKDILSSLSHCYFRDKFKGSDHCPVSLLLHEEEKI